MNNFKKLIKEALTPDFLTESQRQGMEKYREMDYEVWYAPNEGYNIRGTNHIVKPSAYFLTYSEAVEHAELEIDGYLGFEDVRDDLEINENMALSKELENHPDFDTLITALEDSLRIEIEKSLRSGNYNGREGYYLRTPDVDSWSEGARESITRALDKANAKSQDYTFEYESVSDFEEDPGERTWDAAIEFFADLKGENINESPKYLDDMSYEELLDLRKRRASDFNKASWRYEPRFVKDKNNPNFLNVYIDYDIGPGGSSIALGKETMTGQIRRLSASSAMEKAREVAKDLQSKYNLEDIDIVDMENGKVNLFAVSDDFITMDPESVNEMDMNDQSNQWTQGDMLKVNRSLKLAMKTLSNYESNLARLRDDFRRHENKPNGKAFLSMIPDFSHGQMNELNRLYKGWNAAFSQYLQESVNEDEQHLKMPFANNLPQGPKRIEWYGKHLVKMMTPYDKGGPEGLLNALLDNPEDFPENWRVAPEGEVDYIESVFDEIVAFANDYNELTESVNEGWFTKKPIKSTLEGSKILTKYGIKATWDEDGNWVFKSKADEKRAREVLDESVNEMDDNDPVLMMMRANKPSKDTDSTSGIDYDEALSLRIMKRELEKEIDQLWMDMEQEAEPEGGPIADRYGDEIGSLEDRIYGISKQLRDYDMNESVGESKSYRVYLDGNYEEHYTEDSFASKEKAIKQANEMSKIHKGKIEVTADDDVNDIIWTNEPVDEELETPNELADESKQDTSASGAYESKEFDFKKMIKEGLKPNYLK